MFKHYIVKITLLFIISTFFMACGGSGSNSNNNYKPEKTSDNPNASSNKNPNLSNKKTQKVFMLETKRYGAEPWVTDGTSDGTHIIKDINKNAGKLDNNDIKILFTSDNILYFSVKNLNRDIELWKSDGTSEGTRVLEKSESDNLSKDKKGVKIGNTFYYADKDTDNNYKLYKSEGTTKNSEIVKNISLINHSSPNCLIEMNDLLYFVANDGIHGSELWKSDGTSEGTVIVKDIDENDKYASVYSEIYKINNILYFIANDGIHGTELWKSDGTVENTVKFTNMSSDNLKIHSLLNIDNTLYFTAYDKTTYTYNIYKSDGISNQIVNITQNINIRNNEISHLTSFNGVLFFTQDNELYGDELWKSDGTTEGTIIVKDIYNGTEGSYPEYLTVTGDTLYFTALDKVNNLELWKSDGTTEGTVMVKDIKIATQSSLVNDDEDFLFGHFLKDSIYYFTADDGTQESIFWKSDTTEIGTTKVEYLPSNIYNYRLIGQDIYFTNKTKTDTKLLKSNSTNDGYIVIKEFPKDTYIDNLTSLNNMIIFSKNGKELWRSDGTTNGTQKIENFNTNIRDFIQVKNNVYFRANDGIHGYELYKSDGTKEGTLMIKDINPIDDESGFLNILTKVDDTIYFVGNDGIHGNELYKSDGTSEGTMMVKDINIGEASTDFSNAIYIDETIYFTAYANNQYKLYKSNGTNEGTIAIKDIRTGRLIKSKNMFYFNGDDKIYGEELWKSDGTTEGTVMVKDIFKGERGSNPSIICEIDGKILFINEFDDGKPIDIWISDGTKDGTKILKHSVNN